MTTTDLSLASQVEARLRERFAEVEVRVEGGGHHLILTIGDDSFADMREVERSRAVYGVIEDLLAEFHAHTLTTTTPMQGGVNDVQSEQSLDERIAGLIASPVVLFGKGTKDAPRCGFTAGAIETLMATGYDFEMVNILADSELRSAMKTYSDWPTYPQVYIHGVFQGGGDILESLAARDELVPLIAEGFDHSPQAAQ